MTVGAVYPDDVRAFAGFLRAILPAEWIHLRHEFPVGESEAFDYYVGSGDLRASLEFGQRLQIAVDAAGAIFADDDALAFAASGRPASPDAEGLEITVALEAAQLGVEVALAEAARRAHRSGAIAPTPATLTRRVRGPVLAVFSPARALSVATPASGVSLSG